MKKSVAIVALALAIPGCAVILGCISIENHVHMAPGAEGGEAEATMSRAAATNEVSATVRGSVAITLDKAR